MKESCEILPLVNFVVLGWSVKSVVGYVRVEHRYHMTKTKVHIR